MSKFGEDIRASSKVCQDDLTAVIKINEANMKY